MRFFSDSQSDLSKPLNNGVDNRSQDTNQTAAKPGFETAEPGNSQEKSNQLLDSQELIFPECLFNNSI